MRYFLLSVATFICQYIVYGQERPNIVVIISDDHAYQAISAYGDRGYNATPNIDRIANEGFVFNKAYVSNSICGPARAAILTGKFSSANGYKDNVTSRYDSSQNQFVNELQKAGYQTAWIGKYHLGRDPKGFDYSEILPGQGFYFNPEFILPDGSIVQKEGYVSDLIEDTAEKWLDQRNPDKPFCLIIGHKATHRTWMPHLDDMQAFDEVTFPVPDTFFDTYETRKAAAVQDMSIDKTMIMGYDLKMFASEQEADKDKNVMRMTPEQRKRFDEYYGRVHKELKEKKLSGKELALWKYQRYMKDYHATALSLDRNIGRTLDYLKRNNLDQNTIVIYLSDQGFYMGEHGWFDKRFMYEESFRTPMIIRYPQNLKTSPQKVEAHVMNIDIAPTLLEVAGVSIPEDIHGRSFLPILQGKNFKETPSVFYHYYENGEHAVSPHFGIKNKRYKLIRFYKRVEGWEFFDLKKDPKELNNIYGKKKQRIIRKMKKELLDKIHQYQDNDALAIYNTPIN